MSYVSPTSVLGEHVHLGSNVSIWHFCNIFGREGEEVVIGDDTQVGSYSEIKADVRIGKFCRLQSYVFLPEGTRIGDYTFLGPRVTILNDKHPTAEKAVQGTWSREGAIIGSHVSVGGAATIGPGVEIGDHAVIGAAAVVTKNVKPHSVLVGVNRVLGDVREEKYRVSFHKGP